MSDYIINTIRSKELEKSPIISKHDDWFCFNENRSFKWLQKICIRILRRLQCEVIEDTVEIYSVEINNEDITDAILKQLNQVYFIDCITPKYLYIGSEQWDKLSGSFSQFQFVNFKMETNTRPTIFNLEVKVLPWMDGFLVA